jgi:hypothetical protein
MTINIFQEKYLVHPKCGSRFFDEHWGDTRKFIDLFELKDSKFADKIEFIVLREPIEFMKSAVHTEFINFWNGCSEKKGNIIETDIFNYISKEDSQSHWHCHIFRELYLFILKFKKPPTIIMLNDLNHFVKNELKETHSTNFTKTKYDFSQFKIYMSKDDLWDIYIKYNYPKEWLILSNLMEGDEFFWDKLIKLCPVYDINFIKRSLI